MTPQVEKSPSKRARIDVPALGRGADISYPKIARPVSYSTSFTTSVPRTAVGVNEYLYALSLRGHAAVRCGRPPIFFRAVPVPLHAHACIS